MDKCVKRTEHRSESLVLVTCYVENSERDGNTRPPDLPLEKPVWGQEEKWVTEDEIAGWHRQLDGHKFEQASGVGDEQGSLACSVHGVTKSWT